MQVGANGWLKRVEAVDVDAEDIVPWWLLIM